MLVSGGLIALHQGRRALVPLAAQAPAVALFLALVTSHTFYTPLHGRALVDHAGTVAGETPGRWPTPSGRPGATIAAGILRASAIAAVLGRERRSSLAADIPRRLAELVRRWLRIAAMAVVVAWRAGR